MAILLDLIIIGIIVVFGIISAKRGFVKTLTEFIGFFLAVFLAFYLSSAVSGFIYDKFILPSVNNKISESIEGDIVTATDSVADKVWNAVPEFIRNCAVKNGTDKTDVQNSINNNIKVGDKISEVAETAANKIIRPLIVPLVRIVLCIIIFIILLILVKFLSSAINKIFSKKVLGAANKFLGFLLGAGKGAVISLIVAFIVSSIVYLSSKSFLGISKNTIDETYIFKFLSDFNPLIK